MSSGAHDSKGMGTLSYRFLVPAPQILQQQSSNTGQTSGTGKHVGSIGNTGKDHPSTHGGARPCLPGVPSGAGKMSATVTTEGKLRMDLTGQGRQDGHSERPWEPGVPGDSLTSATGCVTRSKSIYNMEA